MQSSYKEKDVVLLLKDITGLVEPQPTLERERLIQAGKHYCEMLPIEYVPSDTYMQVYQESLKNYAKPVAQAVGTLADKIVSGRGKDLVLVSLARAGIPIGILLKRFIFKKYGIETPHYAISIIRGRGIDANAMKFLLQRYQPGQLLFVDGWIGKGAILRELEKELEAYPGISPEIAVLSDPANVTSLCGVHEDILIPSACLNSTVSGLISRTFLRGDIIGADDFHGAVYYGELQEKDLSYDFIHAIEREFEVSSVLDGRSREETHREKETSGLEEVKELAELYGVQDINLIKPGIGETTRVLLRRVPWKILAAQGSGNDPSLAHIFRLAEEKGVPVEERPLIHYKVCGIIKKLADT